MSVPNAGQGHNAVYGTAAAPGGGFIRVNGNPMEAPCMDNKVPPGSPYPPSGAVPAHTHLGVGAPCSGMD